MGSARKKANAIWIQPGCAPTAGVQWTRTLTNGSVESAFGQRQLKVTGDDYQISGGLG
jgi:hypothetical protein